MQNTQQSELNFKQLLKQHTLRTTDTRITVFRSLLQSPGPMSIQEIVKAADNIHFVSVYRTIDTLIKIKAVTIIPHGLKSKYELSDEFKPHHHHATCEKCGTTTEIHDKRIEKLMKELTFRAGLAPTNHHFEMYGLCTKCRE